MGAHGRWIYDADPIGHLRFERPLADLKRRIADEGSQLFQVRLPRARHGA